MLFLLCMFLFSILVEFLVLKYYFRKDSWLSVLITSYRAKFYSVFVLLPTIFFSIILMQFLLSIFCSVPGVVNNFCGNLPLIIQNLFTINWGFSDNGGRIFQFTLMLLYFCTTCFLEKSIIGKTIISPKVTSAVIVSNAITFVICLCIYCKFYF